jgi:outer membrane protein TolC
MTIVLMATVALAGCSIKPQPLTDDERIAQSAADRVAMFGSQEPLTGPLTLDHAFARALKYNLDRRVKLMQTAVAEDDLDLTTFDMLPKLVTDAGYLNRSNADASSSRSILTQQQSLEPSVSSDRDHRIADLSMSWNILDFGVSYYNAREQANRVLIVDEERRKTVQTLMQDVRSAFWRAAAAQKLEKDVRDGISSAQTAMTAARSVESERLHAPLDTLRYQKSLVQILTQLQAVQSALAVAKTELASLIGLPPGQDFTIAAPSEQEMVITPVTMPIEQMEETALLHNPDLRTESLQTRISVEETRKAILGMLPGITFSYGGSYDSNSFLVNNAWGQGAAQLSWNLMNIVSAPDRYHRAKEGEALSDIRRQAVSMAVLAQTHIAYQQYLSASSEYRLADQTAEIDGRIYDQVANRTATDAQGELERIAAQVSKVTSSLLRYQSYAAAQAALGRLDASLGKDPVSEDAAKGDAPKGPVVSDAKALAGDSQKVSLLTPSSER